MSEFVGEVIAWNLVVAPFWLTAMGIVDGWNPYIVLSFFLCGFTFIATALVAHRDRKKP